MYVYMYMQRIQKACVQRLGYFLHIWCKWAGFWFSDTQPGFVVDKCLVEKAIVLWGESLVFYKLCFYDAFKLLYEQTTLVLLVRFLNCGISRCGFSLLRRKYGIRTQ